MNKLSVAIDGPAGAGKSSVAKVLAAKLNYLYIDTGAMYRAVTWAVLQKQISLADTEQIVALLPDLQLTMEPSEEAFRISVWGEDITESIRDLTVSRNVSRIATIGEVREYLVDRQREMAKVGAVILDGRDIGSVVLPNADIKFYLTATVEARAKRRWLEIKDKDATISLSDIQKNVAERDKMDINRDVSPLICVPDAIVVDSSTMTFAETVDTMLSYIETKVDHE